MRARPAFRGSASSWPGAYPQVIQEERGTKRGLAGAPGDLQAGRDAYERRAWAEAYGSLQAADRAAPLGAEDLQLLATSAYMLGRDEEHAAALERAFQLHLDAGEVARAVRCAFWMGITAALRGQTARSSGWLGRAERLVDEQAEESVERGYLLFPAAFAQEASGDLSGAAATVAEAAAIGHRLGDRELFALAAQSQGGLLIRDGRVQEGLSLLDEAMVAVTSGRLGPIVTGLVYCGVILGCQEVLEVRRAREWTEALTRWWGMQPEMVAFTGRCHVHRAEIMQLNGAWPEALEEARRAGERLLVTARRAAGSAFYRQGELHRLRGEAEAAEAAYREASRLGHEPQPGLALLRLEEGKREAAAAALARALAEATEPLARAGLLPAAVEVALAAGAMEDAEAACRELAGIAERFESPMLQATSLHARGLVELARGDARAALVPLRGATQSWSELEIPYEAARARVALGRACGELGDADSAELELEAAREVFVHLGAQPDVARVDALLRARAGRDAHGLTPRELEVLRLVAAGASNRQIAAELVLSERTVDRHVSNLYAKLRVSSRAAATAAAYREGLV